jgi:hypothetical protein
VVALTAALVLVTGYYAWQNRQMVKEMRAARAVAVMPKLAITMTHIGPDLWFPTVVNAGPGAALDVDVEIALEPGAGDRRRWRAAVMAPGERHEFFIREESGQGLEHLGKVVERYEEVTLRGSCTDVLGNLPVITERMELREWRALIEEGGERLIPDYAHDASKFLERIAKAAEKMAR